MTAGEYLEQGRRLEKMIRLQKHELMELRELSEGISSPGFEEHYSAGKNTQSPFEKVMMRIMDMEEKMAGTLDRLLSFKQEILQVIGSVEDRDQRMVLHYRYLCNWTWNRIGEELNWDERTVRRIHQRALENVKLPDNPAEI